MTWTINVKAHAVHHLISCPTSIRVRANRHHDPPVEPARRPTRAAARALFCRQTESSRGLGGVGASSFDPPRIGAARRRREAGWGMCGEGEVQSVWAGARRVTSAAVSVAWRGVAWARRGEGTDNRRRRRRRGRRVRGRRKEAMGVAVCVWCWWWGGGYGRCPAGCAASVRPSTSAPTSLRPSFVHLPSSPAPL